MKERLRGLLLVFLFWIIFFEIGRLYFMLYHWDLSNSYTLSDMAKTFLYGLRLDMSMAGYISIFCGLLITISTLINTHIINKILVYLNRFVIALLSLLLVIDSELYSHWGKHIDASPLEYLKTPKEALGSMTPKEYILLPLVAIIMAALWIILFNKIIKPRINSFPTIRRWKTIPILLTSALLLLPIRGGWGLAPINTGAVYFHSDIYPNHVAVNPVWSFIYALTTLDKTQAKYNFMSDQEAEKYRAELLTNSNYPSNILSIEKPNIIFIVLESFTAKAIEPLGGKAGITPNLNRWLSKGIMFSDFYSSGDRSDKGLVSILSGFPAQPTTSIMKFSQKTSSLPGMPKELAQYGYTSSFYYGGNINFANMYSYLLNIGFQNIVSQDDFPKSERNAKWGVHDEFMFAHFAESIEAEKHPFFKTLYTLSSHEPFDVPMETVIQGNDKESKFLNSIYYTDKYLGKFLDNAEKSTWWDSTIIIITADHGHPLPGNSQPNEISRYHVPLLITGGAIAIPDTVINTIGNHTDIPSTVLHLMNKNSDSFRFSNNLLDSNSQSFSFFIFSKNIGLINPNGNVIYSTTNKQFTKHGKITKEDEKRCQAYLQCLWNDFLSY